MVGAVQATGEAAVRKNLTLDQLSAEADSIVRVDAEPVGAGTAAPRLRRTARRRPAEHINPSAVLRTAAHAARRGGAHAVLFHLGQGFHQVPERRIVHTFAGQGSVRSCPRLLQDLSRIRAITVFRPNINSKCNEKPQRAAS